MKKNIGNKIKELRSNKKMTLRELSEGTGLSIGFLSQLERGLTSIATDSLMKIAEVLNVDLNYFFSNPKRKTKIILRNYEKEVFRIDNGMFINYNLSTDCHDKELLPRLIEVLPNNTEEDLTQYMHEGEEFIYVLEGTLTLFINSEQYDLYPGDSAHYHSSVMHTYANYTNKIVRILEVSLPNNFKDKEHNSNDEN
ncbi:MAG: cupin domain-containing protein [Clostridium argentinense]|uniref:Cupin domain-containing protein n=1 Tax=Clostridium faecium TaxID=2762223 RepID=A0ABR8YSQ8_9CLOT|nr:MULTISPECIES: cupin domain-containing protein [Clostridium]MBD8047295.1 cupin domain-containing protein [Clostridium faecium]MBS5824900.1 cupin domain-containing protein [Clostridium argentinense]MDU1349126.1 cupin domain-containing protein [Clostridium argentinense]